MKTIGIRSPDKVGCGSAGGCNAFTGALATGGMLPVCVTSLCKAIQ